MSRTCQCGGSVKAHGLTDGREAWSCKACGRYEAVALPCAPSEIDRLKTANAELAAALCMATIQLRQWIKSHGEDAGTEGSLKAACSALEKHNKETP